MIRSAADNLLKAGSVIPKDPTISKAEWEAERAVAKLRPGD
ncbi:hypothetical protein [Belnapia rosea]|nr:hypothetical protein [Belnapia rosea]